jgi:hypothetical protein
MISNIVAAITIIITLLVLQPLLLNSAPGRPGSWTGSGLIKDRLKQQPSQTRATRWVDLWPGRTRARLGVFFFQMWDLKSISIYTLCSQEKSYIFSIWDKKSIGLNTST